MDNNILRTELTKSINSLSINKDELKKLFENLQDKANEACIIEVNHTESFGGTDEEINIRKINLKKCSEIKLTIKGYNGEDLFGSIEDVFNLAIFPTAIKSVYVNSEIPYVSQFNYHPRNFFQLFIDFSKPKVFDFSIQPAEKTPNNSYFKVEGYNDIWVNGVFSILDKTFLNKRINFIHNAYFYSIFVWIIGFPFSFWSCFKLTALIEKIFANDTFLISAVFVYVFLLSLLVVRVIFHYARWVFPMIEFKNEKNKSIMHRAFFSLVIIGLFTNFLYDIFKWVLNLF